MLSSNFLVMYNRIKIKAKLNQISSIHIKGAENSAKPISDQRLFIVTGLLIVYKVV